LNIDDNQGMNDRLQDTQPRDEGENYEKSQSQSGEVKAGGSQTSGVQAGEAKPNAVKEVGSINRVFPIWAGLAGIGLGKGLGANGVGDRSTDCGAGLGDISRDFQ
jgi:hypothetical protein